jgi:ketosteroid isomerase-like protein
MKKILVAVLFCTFMTTFAIGQSKEEKEVNAAVEFLRKAMLDGDKTSLDKIAAPELTYGHSNGHIEDKAAFIEALVSGKNDFVTIDLSEQSVKLVGKDLALVRHKLKADTNNGGTPGTANIGILLVFQKQQGQWKLLARQAFKL